MIIQFSQNRFQRLFGIVRYNYRAILIFLVIDVVVYFLYQFMLLNIHLPAVPVSILGGALAIFLGFRNNSAYDRWWEARKIWGGIVNVSRSFSFEVLGIIGHNEISKRLIYRHIAWINSVKFQLRNQADRSEIIPFSAEKEFEEAKSWVNPAHNF